MKAIPPVDAARDGAHPPRAVAGWRRLLLLALLMPLLYLFTGELLQAWIGLHLDAWQAQKRFRGEQHEREWQRALTGAAFAEDLWPWKVSLHRDVARLHLFGARGHFETDEQAAAAMLAAADRADAWSAENAATQLLRARAHILTGDVAALRQVAARLHALAPDDAFYQEPLLLLTARRAVLLPRLKPVALELAERYAARDPGHFAQLRAQSFILRRLVGDLPMP